MVLCTEEPTGPLSHDRSLTWFVCAAESASLSHVCSSPRTRSITHTKWLPSVAAAAQVVPQMSNPPLHRSLTIAVSLLISQHQVGNRFVLLGFSTASRPLNAPRDKQPPKSWKASQLPRAPSEPGGAALVPPKGAGATLCLSRLHTPLPLAHGTSRVRPALYLSMALLGDRDFEGETQCTGESRGGYLGREAGPHGLEQTLWGQGERGGGERELAAGGKDVFGGDSSSDSRSNNLRFPSQISSGGGD